MRFLTYNLRHFFILAICLLLFTSVNAQAAKNYTKNSEQVEVTIFIVPEKEACKTDGFPKYSGDKKDKKEETKGCQPLKLDDIAKWKKEGRSFITSKVAPSKRPVSEISLGSRLMGILDIYPVTPPSDPKDRRAAVFVFSWANPQNTGVTLKREINSSTIKIPTGDWSDELKNQKHWIHQERADALHPANNIKWTLKAGKNEWSFKTTK
jgi:hypothetical protein